MDGFRSLSMHLLVKYLSLHFVYFTASACKTTYEMLSANLSKCLIVTSENFMKFEIAHPDVWQQLNPMPQQTTRNLYANAGEGTAKDLHNLAVLAEQAGDLPEALRLATAALSERPNARIARYLDALERRAMTTPAPTSGN